jgi:hypothetical protein
MEIHLSGYFGFVAEGKMGFYYKEWESLPPLPGQAEHMCIFNPAPHFASDTKGCNCCKYSK